MSDHLAAAKGEIGRAIEAGKADDHPGIGYQVGEMMAHTDQRLGPSGSRARAAGKAGTMTADITHRSARRIEGPATTRGQRCGSRMGPDSSRPSAGGGARCGERSASRRGQTRRSRLASRSPLLSKVRRMPPPPPDPEFLAGFMVAVGIGIIAVVVAIQVIDYLL